MEDILIEKRGNEFDPNNDLDCYAYLYHLTTMYGTKPKENEYRYFYSHKNTVGDVEFQLSLGSHGDRMIMIDNLGLTRHVRSYMFDTLMSRGLLKEVRDVVEDMLGFYPNYSIIELIEERNRSVTGPNITHYFR